VLTDTITTVAALRSPFVLPTGTPMPWQPVASTSADTTGVFASTGRNRFHVTALPIVESAQLVDADVRVTTKQDRPPRGVPR
jgi:hypothetical protein